jgi:hypothetical protein
MQRSHSSIDFISSIRLVTSTALSIEGRKSTAITLSIVVSLGPNVLVLFAKMLSATYYMATAMSDWSIPTWKLIFDAGTQLHGADSPFLWGPASCKLY